MRQHRHWTLLHIKQGRGVISISPKHFHKVESDPLDYSIMHKEQIVSLAKRYYFIHVYNLLYYQQPGSIEDKKIAYSTIHEETMTGIAPAIISLQGRLPYYLATLSYYVRERIRVLKGYGEPLYVPLSDCACCYKLWK